MPFEFLPYEPFRNEVIVRDSSLPEILLSFLDDEGRAVIQGAPVIEEIERECPQDVVSGGRDVLQLVLLFLKLRNHLGG